MTRNRLAIFALSLSMVALLVPSFAQSQNNDFYALYNRYLSHHTVLTPRSAAMGGAYSALRGGSMGLLGNPASIGLTDERFAMIRGDFTEVSSDISLVDPGLGNRMSSNANADMWDVGGGFKMPFEWGGVGLTYDYRSSDWDTGVYPASIGRLAQTGDMERHSVGVTGAYKFNDQIAVGYRYTYIDLQDTTNLNMIGPGPFTSLAIVDEDFSGHKNQVGVQYLASDLLAFGLDGSYGFGDLDSNMSGGGDSDSYSVRAGTSFSFNKDIPLLLALDVNYESRDNKYSGSKIDDDLWGIHLGAEYEVYKNLYLRAGYQYEDFKYEEAFASIKETPNISSWSLGLGYVYDKLSIDYGFMYSDTGDGDMMHVIGLGFNF